jgi:hypothetical protein
LATPARRRTPPLSAERAETSGTTAAKQDCVINPTLHSISADTTTVAFWQRILNDGALQHCNDLEKLVTGCEIIAALDDLDLLAA